MLSDRMTFNLHKNNKIQGQNGMGNILSSSRFSLETIIYNSSLSLILQRNFFYGVGSLIINVCGSLIYHQSRFRLTIIGMILFLL